MNINMERQKRKGRPPYRGGESQKIREAYAARHTGLTPGSKRQLFSVRLEKRKKFRPSLNDRWLKMVQTSRKINNR